MQNGVLSRQQRIDDRFRQFNADNPTVYVQLVAYARQAKRAGHQRMGIAMLWERLRWFMMVEDGEWIGHLNNNYRSRYARLIEETEPDMVGFFVTRRLRE